MLFNIIKAVFEKYSINNPRENATMKMLKAKKALI